MMDNREVRTYRIKDFFGENIDSGKIEFLRDERIVHQQDFVNGRAYITVPDNVAPGLYDIVSYRDDGVSYRVNDVFIAFTPHFYRHAQLHGDLQLLGGNFDGEPIESGKINPEFYNYIDQVGNLKEALDRIARYYAPTGLRWGGTINLGQKIKVEKGQMVYEGETISWDDTYLDYPDVGTHRIGILEGKMSIGDVDFPIATVYRDSDDWTYIDRNLGYIPQERNGNLYYFTAYENTLDDVDVTFDTPEMLQGKFHDSKVYGSAKVGQKDRLSFKFHGTGPVMEYGRLYVYATESYFILFLEEVILTALPRFTNSGVEIDTRLGLIFTSYGDEGYIQYRTPMAYEESAIYFMQGDEVEEKEEDLRKDTLGILPLISEPRDWEIVENGSAIVSYDENYYAKVMLDQPDIYWRLGDEQTNTVDRMGNFNGTLYGSITTGDPNVPLDLEMASSYKFNGGYVQFVVPSMITPEAFTLECWLYPEEIRHQGICVRGDYGWQLRMDNQGRVIYENYPALDGHVETSPLEINEWTHIIALYDPSTNEMKIYKDGVLEDSIATYSGNAQRNLLTYNQSSAEEGTTNGIIGTGCNVEASNEDVYQGKYSFKATCTVAVDYTLNTYAIQHRVPANQSTSAQLAMKAPVGKNVRLELVCRTAIENNYIRNANISVTANGEWQVLDVVLGASDVDSIVHINLRTSDGEVGDITYVDNLQLEYGNQPTPWQPGTGGPGSTIELSPSSNGNTPVRRPRKNLLTYNQSSAEEGTTSGVGSWGTSTNVSASSEYVIEGDYSFRLEATATGGSVGMETRNPPTIPASTSIAAQFGFNAMSGKNVQLTISYRNPSTNAFVASEAAPFITTDGTNQVATFTSVSPAQQTTATLIVRIVSPITGDVLYADNLQLEHGSEATEWEPGGEPYIARWKGNMDEVAYYTKTLPEERILAHITPSEV